MPGPAGRPGITTVKRSVCTAALSTVRATLACSRIYKIIHHQLYLLTQHYQSVADLIHSIKGMGAQNASQKRNRGLGIRRIWQRMIALYEADFRQQDGMAATYHVIMGGGRKPAPDCTREAAPGRQIK